MSSTDLVLSALVSGNASTSVCDDEDSSLKASLSALGIGHKPGDTIIYTTDQAVYHVHFDILAFASPVFTTLLTPCTPTNWFELNETSAVFSTFLQFAYARDLPPINSFATLDNALGVCAKYELRVMHKLLRGLLSDSTSPVFLENDPLLAFGIALKYDFFPELSQASRFLVRSVDLRDTQSIQVLRSSQTGTKVLGMLALRHAKLADLLLSRDRAIVLQNPEVLRQLTCHDCFGNWQSLGTTRSPVQWITQWAQNAYDVLSHSCVTQQERIFYVGYVLEMMSGPTTCGACRGKITVHVAIYEAWMKTIRDKLEQDLVKDLQV